MKETKQECSGRLAVIDCGSNSLKVLVVEREGTGLRMVAERTEEVRLGGHWGSGNITGEALEKAAAAVRRLRAAAEEAGSERIVAVATSAVRDAGNRGGVVEALSQAAGVAVRVLEGDEEARLIARGAATEPELPDARNFCLLDQGGGSLELVFWRDGGIEAAVSAPLGAVRLAHMFQNNVEARLAAEEWEAMRAHVRSVLEGTGYPWETARGRTWVVTGGGVTLARLILAKARGVEFKDYGPWVEPGEIGGLLEKLAGMTAEERRSVPGMPSPRADIFPAGLVPVVEVLRRAGVQRVLHSTRNLRWGIAAENIQPG